MDYSDRVNAKQGGGGVADAQETNVHTKRRLKELLTSQVIDIDNDPYVFRNHLGLLECKLCLTTHVSESSYISHLGGKKHGMNLEKRKVLDERYNKRYNNNNNDNSKDRSSLISINNTAQRQWTKIGKPAYKATKIRDPDTLQMGLLISVDCPNITVKQPFFRFMSYYELSTKNQNVTASFLHRDNDDEEEEIDNNKWQYLIISAEPYENIAFAIPNDKEIDKPQEISEISKTFWWFWDKDSKSFYIQFLYK